MKIQIIRNEQHKSHRMRNITFAHDSGHNGETTNAIHQKSDKLYKNTWCKEIFHTPDSLL